jgi:sulfatase modifying factor 1
LAGRFVSIVVVATVGVLSCGVHNPPSKPLSGSVGKEAPTVEVAETHSPEAIATETSALPGASSACPADMVIVEGEYCPKVKQTCLRWLDAPGPYHEYRCAEYAPSECLAPRVHERFCIDREEYVKPGDPLPLAHQSWTSAGAICAARDGRLCLESEWQFACEGEDMRPYPYGFERDSTACNIDQMNLGKPQAGLNDLRAPIEAYPRCLSPFFVHDMSGNVEEWATLDHGRAPDRSAMKGAWWLPGKNTCRAATLGHGEVYEGPQVGVRCCKDAAR